MPLVTAENISKVYRLGSEQVKALSDVSFSLEKSSFISFVGPSGSGKTTLLNMLGCLDRPTEGRLTVCGTDTAGLKPSQRADFRGKNIGFIFQDFNLIPVLSVYENVEYPLVMVQNICAKERRERIMRMLDAVGMAEHSEKRPSQLSGGQKQRVAAARALVTNPSLILADEPTANLDHETSMKIITLMKSMRDDFGTTFVFSTHDPKVVSEAEHVFVLEDGKLVREEA
ncbi:ABC transporter ATP-binding protein [Seleniivibrio woodruffii]|uniref:ABC transporter ATP-binding protein n=1 Tax=Seleniivibrio woodruffii TaxID=1078050 RepID=UPI00240A3662|nr:ABC transporter ATP-binding protein [Seleniivibrio woodruffii]